jgi:hypothetical protein
MDFFILGFIAVFFGGIYFARSWELFDIYDNEDEEWD